MLTGEKTFHPNRFADEHPDEQEAEAVKDLGPHQGAQTVEEVEKF